MKTRIVAVIICIGFALFAEPKIRYFDGNGNPLPEWKTGAFSIICETQKEWNESGCPHNITVFPDGKLRLKTDQEKQAEREVQRLASEAKAKEDHDKSPLGKLEKEVELLKAEIEKLKKKE